MKRLLVTILIAGLVAWLSTLSYANPIQGGMTGNNGTDTTYTFSPTVNGVLVVNPDAECRVNVRFSGTTAASVVPMTGNSSLFINGWITSVLVDKTTTQRVGVYASEPY